VLNLNSRREKKSPNWPLPVRAKSDLRRRSVDGRPKVLGLDELVIYPTPRLRRPPRPRSSSRALWYVGEMAIRHRLRLETSSFHSRGENSTSRSKVISLFTEAPDRPTLGAAAGPQPESPEDVEGSGRGVESPPHAWSAPSRDMNEEANRDEVVDGVAHSR